MHRKFAIGWLLRSLVVALLLVVSGCGSSGQAIRDSGVGTGTGANGGSIGTDGGGTAGRGGGGAGAGGAAVAVCDQTLANPACWTSVGLAGKVDDTAAWFGGAFDGRYIYVVNSPSEAPYALRHDTQAASPGGGWAASPQASQTTDVWDYQTAAFDGRYLYLVPALGSQRALLTATAPIVALQYDTQGTFGSAGSWSKFDVTTATPTPDAVPGYLGAAFDGRYVYFIPSTGNGPSGLVMRYDTQATFTATTAWSTFDTTTVDPSAAGFSGAAYDGRYLYLVPNRNGNTTAINGYNGLVTRYDAQAAFTSAASWSTFDATSVDPHAAGFGGAVFDGRYIYFVPTSSTPGFASVVTRYDAQGSFTSAASWSAFDTGQLHEDEPWGFLGGAFDGRYVYFAPSGGFGGLVRFDTQASFAATTSWETLQSSAQISLPTCKGTLFDGRYVYFIPSSSEPMAVFEARASAAVPARAHASFF